MHSVCESVDTGSHEERFFIVMEVSHGRWMRTLTASSCQPVVRGEKGKPWGM